MPSIWDVRCITALHSSTFLQFFSYSVQLNGILSQRSKIRPLLPTTRAPSRDNALSAHEFSMKWGRAAAAFLRKMDLIYDQKMIVVASIRPLMTRQVAAEYSATALISCFPFTVSVHSKNETHLLYLYLVYDQRKPMKRLTRADPTELFRFMHSIHLQVIKYSLH